MTTKQQMLADLQDEFNRWENLVSDLDFEQINQPVLGTTWSIKDILAHLMAWQQISIARLEAALHNAEPVFPSWLGGMDPNAEENLELINATIYQTYQSLPWAQVHQAWCDGYMRFLKLGETFSEADLLAVGIYPWIKGYCLLDVLQGSYDHHQEEHLEPLLAWLRQHPK